MSSVGTIGYEGTVQLRFGHENYAGPDAVLFYDDIAASSDRIGCE